MSGAADPTGTAELLRRCRNGDQQALDEVFARVYHEMRAMARQVRRGHSDTVGTTGLIHEAYLKLSNASRLGATDRRHFCRTAAKAMRQILINAAESRRAKKRGGGAVHHSVIDDLVGDEKNWQELLDVDGALRKLREVDERMADIVELRYFGGYTSEECAELLQISTATVQRDWRMARVWLHQSFGATTPSPCE